MPAERRQANARRGLRTLLWALGAFTATQLLGGLLLDYVWPGIRFPTAELTFKALARQPRSPDIMCVGSSRFGAGFVQEHIRDQLRAASGDSDLIVFNAAIEAGDLITARYVMDHAFDQGVRPRILVVEVSPETLARRSEWMGQHVLRQLTWEEIPEHLGSMYRSDNLLRLVSARLLPLHMHRRQICLRIKDAAEHELNVLTRTAKPGKPRKPRPTATPDQGVPWEVFKEMRDDRHDPERLRIGLAAIKRWLSNYRVGGSANRALEGLLARCRQEGCQVILVGVPLAQGHRALYTPAIEQAFVGHMTDVCRRHGCRFVDYRARIPDEMFRDNHHLRRCGGEEFSRLLTQEVLLPAWMERQETMPFAVVSGRTAD